MVTCAPLLGVDCEGIEHVSLATLDSLHVVYLSLI